MDLPYFERFEEGSAPSERGAEQGSADQGGADLAQMRLEALLELRLDDKPIFHLAPVDLEGMSSGTWAFYYDEGEMTVAFVDKREKVQTITVRWHIGPPDWKLAFFSGLEPELHPFLIDITHYMRYTPNISSAIRTRTKSLRATRSGETIFSWLQFLGSEGGGLGLLKRKKVLPREVYNHSSSS